ncbi:unnamed protein product, partial [Ascophyllum nodosum]
MAKEDPSVTRVRQFDGMAPVTLPDYVTLGALMNSLRSKSLLSTPTIELKGWTGPPLNKVREERDYSAQKEAAGDGGAPCGANVFVHSRLLTGEVLDVWTRGNQCTCKDTRDGLLWFRAQRRAHYGALRLGWRR